MFLHLIFTFYIKQQHSRLKVIDKKKLNDQIGETYAQQGYISSQSVIHKRQGLMQVVFHFERY